MSNDIKEKVFRETRRVLKQGGEFWIWDAPMVTKNKVFAIRLKVDFHDMHTINTVFGVKTKDQNAISICRLLQKAKFTSVIITDRKDWFFIKARKV